MRYLVRSGCGWEMLPTEFGPWQTVYGWFRGLMRRFLFQTIHDLALMCDRERTGREASPSATVVDSQSVKAPAPGAVRGYYGVKKVMRRKRPIAVDTAGRLLMVNLTRADISDSAGKQIILDAIRKHWPWVRHLFADGAYDQLQLMDKAAGIQVPPRRRAVERSFGCMTRCAASCAITSNASTSPRPCTLRHGRHPPAKDRPSVSFQKDSDSLTDTLTECRLDS